MALPMLVALAQGCSEELGPEPMETTRVSGVVTEGGRPVGRGWVEFVPYAGTVGKMRSAPLGPDGRFVADGVAVGLNRIGIAGAPIGIPGGRRFFDPLGSPIRRRLTRAPSDPITIDLIDEYALGMSARHPDGER